MGYELKSLGLVPETENYPCGTRIVSFILKRYWAGLKVYIPRAEAVANLARIGNLDNDVGMAKASPRKGVRPFAVTSTSGSNKKAVSGSELPAALRHDTVRPHDRLPTQCCTSQRGCCISTLKT